MRRLIRDVSLSVAGQDFRFAVRGLRRSPGLSAAIIGTIGIGVGMNAALFTVVDRLFFQAPNAVVAPEQVRRLYVDELGMGGRRYTTDRFSIADQQSLQDATGDSVQIEGYAVRTDRTIDQGNAPRTVGYATSGFFSFAGTRPFRGRFFLPSENTYGDPRYVAVLSHDFWQSAYGADSAILGRSIHIDTATFTVVGIASPGFGGMDLSTVDVWTPLAALPGTGEGAWWTQRFGIMRLFARLSASTNEAALAARLNARYGVVNEADLRRDPAWKLVVAPLLQARGNLRYDRQDARNIALLKRLGGVGIVVLLIAMTNMGSLLLMRAVRRRREMAVRLALGSSHRRLFMQLLNESLLLAAIGGCLALSIAWFAGGMLRQLLFPDTQWSATVIDRRVVVATALITIAIACIAGLAPATMARRRDLMEALKSGGAEAGQGRSRLRIGLLATQTALCTIMVMLAGVFTQSLRRASNVDLGFDADRLITVAFHGSRPGAVDEALSRIASLPPVAAVTRSSVDLIGGRIAGVTFQNGDSVPAIAGPTFAFVDSAYLSTLGLRLRRGRWLAPDDRAAPSVVINDAMAQSYWPGKDPVGECFFAPTVVQGCLKIVGVIENVRWDLTDTPLNWMYFSAPASGPPCCSFLTVRTAGRATPLIAAQIREVVAHVPGVNRERVPNPRLIEERHEPFMRPWRLSQVMFLAFAVLALAAAAAGIYGLVAYDVAQRAHEFGVRTTLGASRGHLLRLVMTSGVRIVLWGVGIGLVASAATGRLVASLLFETAPYDPTVVGASALTLLGMACLASIVPAWRAAAIDPAMALRAE